jgi:tRNA pseudouridine38-40 synthase
MLSQETNRNRYFIEFAYHGKYYHGWQIQPNAITVQEVMNKAFTTLLGEEINLLGAGRTDTGVHAAHFVAHMDLKDPVLDTDDLIFKANRFLQFGIRIDSIRAVDSDLHARFSAISRTYHYIITQKKSPFLDDFSWYLSREMNLDSLSKASDSLLSFNDFTSFARLHADTKTNNCVISHAAWNREGEYLIFSIKADRFLRNMVRAIVGTLVDVGIGKIGIDDFRNIILAKDRSAAGQSAPAQGLFLTHVEYPAELFETTARPAFYNFF